MMDYLHRVEAILLFVAATRNTDLKLHLQAREQLSQLFYAFDLVLTNTSISGVMRLEPI